MKNLFSVKFGVLLSMLLIFTDCNRVPVTGRRQLNLLPNSQVLALADNQYRTFLNENQVVAGTAQSQMVERVGNNIAAAVEEYFRMQEDLEELEGYNWEFKLVQDPSANAFAMPGGKVVVFTGLLDIAETPEELAVVMGHEVAHAIAEHGNERMSQQLSAQLGGVALSTALSRKPALTQQLFMAAYGVGSQVGVLLPYSRLQETEADKLGLIFMALAGYNPEVAVQFWREMAQASQGQQPPQLLSTHPGSEKRIKEIQDYLPEVKEYYNPQQARR